VVWGLLGLGPARQSKRRWIVISQRFLQTLTHRTGDRRHAAACRHEAVATPCTCRREATRRRSTASRPEQEVKNSGMQSQERPRKAPTRMCAMTSRSLVRSATPGRHVHGKHPMPTPHSRLQSQSSAASARLLLNLPVSHQSSIH
jgi:hypothetical protein